ncbi:MAG: hypothetical protein KA479_06845 [Saprospiraceae bacterium]|nr:hypothetical protein [Saprospiraceae bacterium]
MLRKSWIDLISIGLVFFMITVAFYWPVREAGFTSDFTGHLEMFEQKATIGWWNSFGWRSNQPVLFGFMFFWYKLFSLSPLPWFFLFTAFHAFNALLLFQLTRHLLLRGSHQTLIPALSVALLFLTQPYQVEVVTWKVCIHYLLSTGSILGMLLMLFRSPKSQSIPYWITFHTLFALALFSLELAFIFPLIVLVTLAWIAWEENWDRKTFRRLAGFRILPQVAFMALYFIWNRIRLGTWIGHYGEEVHLRLSLDELISHTLNYFLKYLLFTRDWGHEWKAYLGDWPERDTSTLYLAGGIALLLMVGMGWYSAHRDQLVRTATWAIIVFLLALGPVLTLYFAWAGYSENDRYGYLASSFFILGLVLLLWRLPRPYFLAIIGLLLVVQTMLLNANIDRWRQGQRVYASLLTDYRWEGTSDVYILGMPDNYDGINLFRGFIPGEGIHDALQWVSGKPPSAHLTEVAAFVMRSPLDAVRVHQEDSLNYTVSFNQWGNWFVRKGLGASDYETEAFKVDFNEGGYRLTFNRYDSGRTLLYSDGGRWKIAGQ